MAKATLKITVFFVLCVIVSSTVDVMAGDALDWPQVCGAETRPWTWWHWHGCAVNKADITGNLESLHESGMGGVIIVNLLDVRDEEAVKLPYLSKEWAEAVAHTVREARRLGMGVDMSPVPGWAFGGAWVPRGESAAIVNIDQFTLSRV